MSASGPADQGVSSYSLVQFSSWMESPAVLRNALANVAIDRKDMTMRRRTRHEAFPPAHRPRWLVILDRLNEVISSIELAAPADSAQVLIAAMEQLEADGWLAEEPPSRAFAGFFVERDGVRLFVHIVAFDPSCPPHPRKSGELGTAQSSATSVHKLPCAITRIIAPAT